MDEKLLDSIVQLLTKLGTEVPKLEEKIESMCESEWASIEKVERYTDLTFDKDRLVKYSNDAAVQIQVEFDKIYGTVDSYHSVVWRAVYAIDISEVR